VSYNLKKLVELGYMHHQRCSIDRRAVRVRLTEKGRMVRDAIDALFARHADGAKSSQVLTDASQLELVDTLRRIERFWGEQIRYIY
jgi:DNA-binding MarR family transcriptional regulator